MVQDWWREPTVGGQGRGSSDIEVAASLATEFAHPQWLRKEKCKYIHVKGSPFFPFIMHQEMCGKIQDMSLE